MWLALRRVAEFAVPDAVVKPDGASSEPPTPSFHVHPELTAAAPPPAAAALANALSVESAVLLNSTLGACTDTAARVLTPALSFAMGDLFSLSVLQILSVLSFLTSVLALVRVGSGSLHRFSHKFEAINQPAQQMNVAGDTKPPLFNWSSLGGSFSLGSLIGEDEEEEVGTNGGYTGGSDLMRMDWQLARPVSVQSPQHYSQYSQPPISMAKLIMSRHLQRKPSRQARRMQGTAKSAPRSRLTQTYV